MPQSSNQKPLTRRERLLPVEEQEPEEPSLLDDILSTYTDMPSRIWHLGEYMARRVLSGTAGIMKSPEESMTEEERKKAMGGLIDVALMAIPGGKIAQGIAKPIARVAGKQIANAALRYGIRPAVTGAKMGALLPNPEEAASLEGRAKSAAIGAALGPVVEPAVGAATKLANVATPKIAAMIKRSPAKLERQAMKKSELEAAKAIEKKTVSDIAEQDVPKLVYELDELTTQLSERNYKTLEQLGNIKKTGTLQPKEIRSEITNLSPIEGAASELISPNELLNVKRQLVTVGGKLKALAENLANTTSPDVSAQYRLLRASFIQLEKKFYLGRRAAGLSLQTFQKGVHELKELGISLANIHAVEKGPAAQEILKALRSGSAKEIFSQANLRNITQMWRVGIFPLLSAARDSFTNTAALISHAHDGFVADIFDKFATGASMDRTKSLLMSIARTGRMPASIKEMVDPVAMSEKIGINFSKNIDKIVYLTAHMKRGVDIQFQKWGAMSSLYEQAIQAGKKSGLHGDELTQMVRHLVLKPNEQMAAKAREVGLRMGFSRQLAPGVESFASSPYTKLFVNPFMRWTFQFTKFLAEHTPMDPQFWSKAAKGAATNEDFVKFMTRNFTGAGGLDAIDKLVYDNVDFNTMEYVREDGQRIRLQGLTPIPDLLLLAAILKKDKEKAIAAISATSIVGANLQGGILSTLLSSYSDMYSGRLSPEAFTGEFTKLLASFVPGQGVLTAIERLFDTTQRDVREFPSGLAANIPFGVSKLAQPYIDPTTGQPRRQLAKLPAALGGIVIPDINIPGVPAKLNAIEREFRELGMSTMRPRRTPLLDYPTPEDVPDELAEEYQQLRGIAVNRLAGPLVTNPVYKNLAQPQKKKLLQQRLNQATKAAKMELARRHKLAQ